MINNYMSFETQFNNKLVIINKGTGAGGKNTNKNGLSYEKLTDLSTEYKIIKNKSYGNKIRFKYNKSKMYISTKQSNVFKYLKNYINLKIPKAHGCKNPDECFIDENNKIIFII